MFSRTEVTVSDSQQLTDEEKEEIKLAAFPSAHYGL